MSFNIKRKFYESLPIPIKRSVCIIPFSWWGGRAYRSIYRRGAWFDRARPEELWRYQEQELGKVLRFATDQVPAYQSLRPIVDRYKPIRGAQGHFRSWTRTRYRPTSGVSYRVISRRFHIMRRQRAGQAAISSKFISMTARNQWNWALCIVNGSRVGYMPGHRKATFRGVSFPNLKPGVFWQHNPIYNELQFSPFHMNEANLGAYIDQIIRFAPSYLHGYPSALDVLAEYILRHNQADKMPRINAALLGSEGVSMAQRERIERAFRTRAYSWYGHSERVVLAGECEKNSTYHHFPDYGILEIIDDEGNPCDKAGERGEIVGTGLFNRCMPLIRYRTGDYATRMDSRCECGRVWDRFTDVEGHRKQEMIVGKTGARISIAALNMHGPLFERVVRFQYFQDTPGVCVLKIMVAPEFTEQDRMAIEAAYKVKVGDEVQFNVVVVDEIPLTVRGKSKMVDSRLNTIIDA